jgi:hypothetical protein
MLGTKVLITGEPKGRVINGIVSGTPSPGTIMQIANAVEPVSGRYTWEVFDQAADGDRPSGPVAVLLEKGEGYDYSTAYEDGYDCRVYIPLHGDELNMLVAASGTATSDAQAIGDKYIIEDGTGLLIATTGTPECEPFTCMETLTDVVAAGTMTHVIFTGF